MNKTLIVYHSKYGFTKRYAQWLAAELNADICEGKNVNASKFKDYSTILFGSSLYAGSNKAANLLVKYFEQAQGKKVVLFTCGMFDVTNEANVAVINKELDKVITPEIRQKIKVFHLRGGIDHQNLSFLHKTMMKFPYAQIKKKPENERTDADRDFLALYGRTIDFSDKKMLEPIIKLIQE
jgi:menaquinone-dependent protoporphyrinogen IX oxidase